MPGKSNAFTISQKIIEPLTIPSVSLDPCNIRGQAYDSAAVMSSEIAGVQAIIIPWLCLDTLTALTFPL